MEQRRLLTVEISLATQIKLVQHTRYLGQIMSCLLLFLIYFAVCLVGYSVLHTVVIIITMAFPGKNLFLKNVPLFCLMIKI